MSEKLRFFDPQLKEKPEKELFDEPEWLIHLRQLDGQIKVTKTKNVWISSYSFGQSSMARCVFKGGVSHLFPFSFLSGSE